jgi:hypothetical protein
MLTHNAAQHCPQEESLTLPVASATALFFIAAATTGEAAAARSDTKYSITYRSSDSTSAAVAAVPSRRLWGLSIVRPVVSSRNINPSLKLLEYNTQHCSVCNASSNIISNGSGNTIAVTADSARKQCLHARNSSSTSSSSSSSSSSATSGSGSVVSSVTAAGGSLLCVQEGAVLRWNAASGHCDQILAAAVATNSNSSKANSSVQSVSCSASGNSSRGSGMLAVTTARGSVDVYMFKGL